MFNDVEILWKSRNAIEVFKIFLFRHVKVALVAHLAINLIYFEALKFFFVFKLQGNVCIHPTMKFILVAI